MTKTLTIRPLDLDMPAIHKFGIGFDSMIQELMRTTSHQLSSNYPPHNVIKTGEETVTIEVAIAGFDEGDVTVTTASHSLTIVGSKDRSMGNVTDLNVEYLHRGIGTRDFKLSFTLAEYVEIVNASVKNGILSIYLERKIPEEKKPRNININYI